jgi:hypothetical protein
VTDSNAGFCVRRIVPGIVGWPTYDAHMSETGRELSIEEMWDGLIEITRETWAEVMALGAVPPPVLMAWNGPWFVGYVQLRPVQTGDDAATGIAEMSALAAAAGATDVAVFYETQDMAIACDHVPLHAGPAMNAVRAWPGGRAAYRFPYTERRLRGRAPGGLIRAAPEWLPALDPDADGLLEPAIEGLLDFCWRPVEVPAGGQQEPEEMVRRADIWLRHEGYQVRLAVPPGASNPDDGPPDRGDEAGALWRDLEPYVRAGPAVPPIPPELAERAERFAIASGVDPDTVMPIHVHRNPVTGATVVSSPWPCPQCVALGRTEPLQYGKDVPDSGGYRGTPIPPDRLEAYLASFPRPPAASGSGPRRDSATARRKSRRKAERQTRRKKR